MTTDYFNAGFKRTSTNPEYRAMVSFGLWLRAGSIGLAATAIGFIMLATAEVSAWIAIATLVAGAVVAVVSWRKALAIVHVDDAKVSIVPPSTRAVTSPLSEFGQPAGPAASS